MDSCCFIDLASGRTGQKVEAGRPDELWYVESLLTSSANRDVEIYTLTSLVSPNARTQTWTLANDSASYLCDSSVPEDTFYTDCSIARNCETRNGGDAPIEN
jgi:hypothetical protein